MSILEVSGNTPRVELKHPSPDPRVRIPARLEGSNPGGAAKGCRVKLILPECGDRSGSTMLFRSIRAKCPP